MPEFVIEIMLWAVFLFIMQTGMEKNLSRIKSCFFGSTTSCICLRSIGCHFFIIFRDNRWNIINISEDYLSTIGIKSLKISIQDSLNSAENYLKNSSPLSVSIFFYSLEFFLNHAKINKKKSTSWKIFWGLEWTRLFDDHNVVQTCSAIIVVKKNLFDIINVE